ncbi:vitamin K epoxide reductase family protein [Pedobacter alpinus]|uniref:Vitamin K epoxide reductase family protein n=1 Tax=Pedobacter alpinus TaxID=1590643 RepID=A0ABW5TNC7_9SPHI
MKFKAFDNATISAIRFSELFGFNPKLSFNQALQQHPYYPSLFSISEVLEQEAGIENFAVKITLAQLQEVNLPCLVHLKTKGGEYALISQIKSDTVFYEINGKKLSITIADFEKIWTGVALLTEVEKKTLQKRIKLTDIQPYIIPALFLTLLTFIFLNTYSASIFEPFVFTGIFLCLLSGLTVVVLLLIQSLGKGSAFIQQLCGADAKHNCNHIINSKAANVTQWFSLSDLGFLYFAGNLLLLFFSQNSTAVIFIVAFNFLALPFTLWSVYYQWRIAKTWCRLCLVIQGLFWVQALFSVYFITQSNFDFSTVDVQSVLLFLLVYITPPYYG